MKFGERQILEPTRFGLAYLLLGGNNSLAGVSTLLSVPASYICHSHSIPLTNRLTAKLDNKQGVAQTGRNTTGPLCAAPC